MYRRELRAATPIEDILEFSSKQSRAQVDYSFTFVKIFTMSRILIWYCYYRDTYNVDSISISFSCTSEIIDFDQRTRSESDRKNFQWLFFLIKSSFSVWKILHLEILFFYVFRAFFCLFVSAFIQDSMLPFASDALRHHRCRCWWWWIFSMKPFR